MAVLVQNQGADWSAEQYDEIFARVISDRSNPPAGLIAHFATPRGDGWQVVEVWESEQAWQTFLNEKLMPAAQDMQAPPFDSQTFEVHNMLVP